MAIGAWGFSQIRELGRAMEDPVVRTELAIEFLATDELPEGYNAVAAISIPFLMETVVLTDKEPGEDDEIRGFGYIGVDLDGADGGIDCWLQGDFRAIRSGS